MSETAIQIERDKVISDITARKKHLIKNRQLMLANPADYIGKKSAEIGKIDALLKLKYDAIYGALEDSGLPEKAKHKEAQKAVDSLYREEMKVIDETFPEEFIGKGVEIIKSQKAKLPSEGTARKPRKPRKKATTPKKATAPKRKPGRPRKK